MFNRVHTKYFAVGKKELAYCFCVRMFTDLMKI